MTPNEAINKQLALSEEYSRLTEEGTVLEKDSIIFFRLNRKNFKSDTACEREWQATDNGLKSIEVSRRIKAIEKELSVLSNLLRYAENTAKGVY